MEMVASARVWLSTWKSRTSMPSPKLIQVRPCFHWVLWPSMTRSRDSPILPRSGLRVKVSPTTR